MLVRRLENVDPQPMAMPGASGVHMRLLVGRDDGAPTFAMRAFDVQPGGHTPRHQHNYEHEVLVLEGEGQVLGGLDGGTIRPIAAGDAIFMPANELHQFRNTGKGVLRFLCLIPVAYDCGSGQCMPTPGS